MRDTRYDYPGGRPVRKVIVKGGPRYRLPEDGTLIPRLRIERKDTTAIGFIVLADEDTRDE